MSTVIVNTLTGTTTAGSISVTGEGNSTTTNMQQGLCKHWVLVGSSGNSVTDSFNNASVADNGTGDYTVTRTNNMANATFCVNVTSGSHADGQNMATDTATQTTAVFDIRGANAAESATADITNTNGAVWGDLA
jgi:hypothetical protein